MKIEFDPLAVEKHIMDLIAVMSLDKRIVQQNVQVSGQGDKGNILFDITLQVPDEVAQVRFSGELRIEVNENPQPR